MRESQGGKWLENLLGVAQLASCWRVRASWTFICVAYLQRVVGDGCGSTVRCENREHECFVERTFDDAKMDLTQTIRQQGHFNKDVQRRFGRLLIDRRHLEL